MKKLRDLKSAFIIAPLTQPCISHKLIIQRQITKDGTPI